MFNNLCLPFSLNVSGIAFLSSLFTYEHKEKQTNNLCAIMCYSININYTTAEEQEAKQNSISKLGLKQNSFAGDKTEVIRSWIIDK